jgi:hypothetical protein
MLSMSAAAQAPGPSPTEVIRQEYEALNQHDVGRVFSLYSDSIKYGELRDSVLIAPSSKAALRASVEPFLAKNPRGKVTVVHQIVLGRFVIADQRMTGTSDGTPFELLDVSEVRGGRVVAELETADIAATPAAESRQADAVATQMNDGFARGDAAAAVSGFADPVLFHVWGEDSVRHMSAVRVRQGFRDLMTTNPHMHYVITDRMVAGRFVVQHERLTGMADGKRLDAWAILEVRFGRIIAEWECLWTGSTEAAN